MRIAVDHRDAILQTAARLFARKPFHEVLMDEVAVKAGIAKGTIYRYFANKDELFGTLATQWLELLGAETEKASQTDAPPVERMRIMLQRAIEVMLEQQDFFQVMQRHECEVWAHKSNMLALRARNRERYVKVLREAIADGSLVCPFDPVLAVDMLWGMVRNVMRFSDPMPSPAEVAEMATSIFADGLRPRNSTNGSRHSNRRAVLARNGGGSR